MSDAFRVQTSSASLSTLDADRAALSDAMSGQGDASASGVTVGTTTNRAYTNRPSTGESTSSQHTRVAIPMNVHKGTVEVGGTRTTIEAAIAAGLVTRDAAGNVHAVAQEGQQQAPQQEQAPADDSYVNEREQEAFGAALAGVPEHVASGALSSAVACLAAGDDLTAVVDRMGRSGMDPDTARNAINNAYAVLEPAFNRALESQGIAADEEDRQAFYSYARAKGGAFSSALNQALQGNSTSELKALAASYVRITTPNQSDLAAEGLKSEYRNGELFVNTEDGQWFPARGMRINRGNR